MDLNSIQVMTMARRRKYDSIRRVEFILPPGKVEEMEKAKGKKPWGEFVWELWEFWKVNHPESTAD